MHILALILILIFFTFTDALSQIRWRLQPSGGFYISGGSGLANQQDILIKLLGEIEYSYTRNNNRLSAGVRFGPELYGSDRNLTALYTRLNLSYGGKLENLDWNILLTRRSQTFKGLLDLSVTGYIADFNLKTYIIEDTPLILNSGIAWQDLSRDIRQNYTLIYTKLTPVMPISPSMNFSWGGYVEYFFVDRASSSNDLNNEGWRVGPVVALNYLKNYIFNLDYRILLHESQLTSFPSYEQQIRLLGGLGIGKRWFIFVFADYYIRNLEARNEAAEDYVSLNLENQVFLKTSHQINKAIEFSFKTGYSRNNFSREDLSFGSWQILFALSVKKQRVKRLV